MAYASYRCLVNAPLAKVWNQLSKTFNAPARTTQLQGLRAPNALREEVLIDASKSEITIRLMAGQELKGERRFVLKSNAYSNAAILDTMLDWSGTSPELEQELMRAAVEILVRDFALEIKQLAEVG